MDSLGGGGSGPLPAMAPNWEGFVDAIVDLSVPVAIVAVLQH
jgi:hypothetical protein